MKTRYLLTFCAAMVVGAALIAAPITATAAGKTENKASLEDSWVTAKTKIALFADARVKGTQINVETKEGLVMIQSVAFNLALPWTADWNPSFWPDKQRRQAIVQRAIQGFQIRLADPQQHMAGLSGGNQQKALVARRMERRPKILILDEPTRGVDVGARKEMFSIISSLVEEGMAVLFISSDLSEILNMSHRIGIYRDGRIVETVGHKNVTAEGVMARLTGAERYQNG